MSDKSFGDHANRNIVKNPLLSTAVTGLSIEDLTHNAVLLPAAPTQTLITRSDDQIGTHHQTLARPDNDLSNYPTLEPNSNLPTSHSTATFSDILEHEKDSFTQSKASAKSEDDFDVSEYFARLQGTRYVSAPYRSHSISEQNANLPPEENLEEINLNDDKPVGDVQQSLTADIAQNFSQLPTVLPHVASAVFSSFSNMLNLKSREQTPDAPKHESYLGQQQVETVPLMGVDSPVVKEVAPPPKEPPISGPSNYRISTKKKYAQIPGLSSGETHVPNPIPIQQTVPSYFVPTYDDKIINLPECNEDQFENVRQMDVTGNKQMKPPDNTQNFIIQDPKDNIPHVIETSSEIQPNLFCVAKSSDRNFFEQKPEMQSPQINVNQSNVIPPPPMFSTQRRDIEASIKPVLPPSVARRIGSNHPIIKQQTVTPAPLISNIFVPTFEPTPASESPPSANVPLNPEQATQSSIFSSNIYQPPLSEYSQLSSNLGSSSNVPPPMSQGIMSVQPSSKPSPDIAQSIGTNIPFVPTFFSSNASTLQYSNMIPPDIPGSTAYASKLSSETHSEFSTGLSISSSIPQDFSNIIPSQQSINVPPTLFNPITSHETSNPQLTPFIAPPPIEPPKSLTEPPKSTGAINYRMTKKRPQYYSGPIEGLGSISTNTKPILPAAVTSSFQGALFTPEQHSQTEELTSTPFDISQSIVASTLPLDASRPIEHSSFVQYDVNKCQEQSMQPHFETAFDLSRPAGEPHNPASFYEPKGFGIIGSLKSKLSSIDINKIQNTVTNFFDPAYNENKDSGNLAQETTIQQPNQQYQSQEDLQIFVPNVQHDTRSYGPHGYQTDQKAYYEGNSYYSNQYNYHPHAPHLPVQTNDSVLTPQKNSQTMLPPAQIITSSTNSGIQESDLSKTSFPVKSFVSDSEKQSSVPTAPAPETSIFSPSQQLLEHQSQQPPIFYNPNEFINKIKDEPVNFFTPPSAPYQDPHHNILNQHVTAEKCTIESRPTTSTCSQIKLDKLDDTLNYLKSKNAENIPISVTDTQTVTHEKDIVKNTFSEFNVATIEPGLMKATQENLTSIDNYSAINFFEIKTQVINPSLSTIYGAKESQASATNIPLGIKTQSEEVMDSFKSDYFDSNKHKLEIVKDSTPSITAFTDSKIEPVTLEGRIETGSKYLTQELPKSDSLLESITKNEIPIVGVSSIPLFGLSTMIADKSKETKENNIETNKMALFGTLKDVQDLIHKNASVSFFENIGSIQDPVEDSDNVSELNICETCREVNKPEDIDDKDTDDLTTQLIENITSPIQLANPVEVPLPDTNASINENIEFDTNQFNEISHITEETIDTINVQSATELLEDVEEVIPRNYGWSREENYNDSGLISEALVEHDYSFKIDPDSIGFYGNNSLFFDNVPTNASDEIKAELKHHDDLLPRQMSIPSAPPAEDDTKSDETGGLDVHSIELDAKKDFPVYEEFVIEPSETDDDKIEYKEREKTEEPPDTFTDRIEKFKKIKETGNEEQRSQFFRLSSPPISMASYFDTGNFAVETHYRNSISSPSQVNVPPGFEDEFQLARLAMVKTIEDLKTVPDTSTQTKTTSAVTYSAVQHIAPVGFNVETDIAKLVDDSNENLPDFTADLDSSIESSRVVDKLPDITKCTTIEDNVQKLPDLSSIFDSKTETDKEAAKLPDPINFFSSGDPPEAAESFNRLASYFASPPKTDHAKSFFELSQSQNHYRHDIGTKTDLELDKNKAKEDKYLNLMKDLTSIQNIAVPTDQTVRHVNYFTVEYDSELIKDFSRGVTNNELAEIDDKIEGVFGKCEFCCNALNFDSNSKFRKAMDDNNTELKKSDTNMDSDKENSGKSVSINFEGVALDEEANDGVTVLTEGRSSADYSPVKYHWFYRVDVEDKSIWRGFSVADSSALETAFLSPDLNETTLVATDGGRYDVNVVGRLRIPVYWDDKPTNVRRCSWFYRGQTDARYVPYTEPVAEKLEEEYRHGVTRGEWHRRLMLPNGEMVVMHGPGVMVHFLNGGAADTFTTAPLFPFGKRVYRNPPKLRVSKDQPKKIDHLLLFVHGAGEFRNQREKRVSTSRPRVVRRGHDESEIEDSEPSSIDHLLLLCHGVGSACDMRFRSVEEVVEDFRATSLQLLQSHYRNSYDSGVVSRIEVLPISWHASLHSGETGVDRRLAQVTLASIPRLRHFTNDTILDVLFYTSPVYCQTILNTVCGELNRIYKLFKQRNPDFKGGISLGGHSLGSVILYDLLCNQTPDASTGETKSTKTYVAGAPENRTQYPQLVFAPDALYALGSPIAIFECIRGVETLGLEFDLPTCKKFFNIFHPYDPIAYRIEPLVNSRLKELKPFLIPHHKGRKRMHLELKDTMARVGADLKQKLMESLRTTWNKWTTQPAAANGLSNVMEEDMEREQLNEQSKEESALESELATASMLGRLNAGQRIDYVLQEAPLEMINEYIFAMSSHVGYWESEDTMLLMLREIYGALGVQPDCTVPQQSLTVQRDQDETVVLNTPDFPSTSHGAA